MSRRKSADEIEEEAVRWVWRTDREGRTPELERWLAEDSRHRGAFLQAEATWALLDRRQLDDVEAPRVRTGLSKRRLLIGGAALAASAAGAVYLILPQDRYGTSVGEIRRVPMKDGSTAIVNTDSLIELNFRSGVRRVRVAQGEVWFQVASNPSRPFVVEAGPIRIRAVGTAFSVRRRRDSADVLVSEGAVETWVEANESQRATIAAGGAAFVSASSPMQQRVLGPSEIDRQLSWRVGKIDLAGETLAEAVAEFNRYNSRKIILADPELAGRRFYGVFGTDDPQGFAAAVQRSLGVELDSGASERIVLGGSASP